jgi:DinB superfamily
MPIVPDGKDWTWVLERSCPECGYDCRALVVQTLPELIRRQARAWQQVLAADPERVARRPDDDTWSALEYGCHIRDVFDLFDQRLALMLAEQSPTFANWDQDLTATQRRYAEQQPSAVAAELVAAADRIADRFAAVTAEQWQRVGLRSDGARFTVDSFGRYFLHDVVHHLHDVGQG